MDNKVFWVEGIGFVLGWVLELRSWTPKAG
jgi:hypothetical protein